MTPNPHALKACHATRYGYHEIRVAVNVLVNFHMADREHAERLVDEWIAEDTPNLEARARAVGAEFA